MTYNPYDLVSMRIDGKDIMGRPIEFDTDIVDFKTLENAFGKPVRPKRLSTTCPNCGQGMIVEVNMPEPPFPVVECSCTNCHPGASPLADPFNNPIESGKISRHELDPLLHDMSQTLEPQESSVADRLPASVLESAQESLSLDAPPLPANEANEDLIAVLTRGESQPEEPESQPEPPAQVQEEPESQPEPPTQVEEEQPELIEKADKPEKGPKKPKKNKKADEPEAAPTESITTPEKEPGFDDSDLAEPQ